MRILILTSILAIGLLGCDRVYEAVQSGCWGDCLWQFHMQEAGKPAEASRKHPLYPQRAVCLAVIYQFVPELLPKADDEDKVNVTLARVRNGMAVHIMAYGESPEGRKIIRDRGTIRLWCQQVPYEDKRRYSPKGRIIE